MSLVTQDIANLINGVSQQPDVLRLPSQGAAQENCQSSVVYGLTRRPPSRHIAKISSGQFATAFFHLINRDSAERYAVVITNGNVQAFDLFTGAERLVTKPGGTSYLTSANPGASFKAVTAADYTFLLNRSAVAGMTGETAPAILPQALLSFYAVQYKEKFIVRIDGTSCTYDIPAAATGGTNSDVLNTNSAAYAFKLLMAAAFPAYTLDQQGSNILIRRTDGVDFTIQAEDSAGGTHMKAHKGVVQNFSDLPKTGIDGFKIKVIGSPSDPSADYWVQYQVQTADAVVIAQPAGGNTGAEPPNPSGIPWWKLGDDAPILTF